MLHHQPPPLSLCESTAKTQTVPGTSHCSFYHSNTCTWSLLSHPRKKNLKYLLCRSQNQQKLAFLIIMYICSNLRCITASASVILQLLFTTSCGFTPLPMKYFCTILICATPSHLVTHHCTLCPYCVWFEYLTCCVLVWLHLSETAFQSCHVHMAELIMMTFDHMKPSFYDLEAINNQIVWQQFWLFCLSSSEFKCTVYNV